MISNKPSRCDLYKHQPKKAEQTHSPYMHHIYSMCFLYRKKASKKVTQMNFHCLDVAEDFHRHLGVEFHAGNRFFVESPVVWKLEHREEKFRVSCRKEKTLHAIVKNLNVNHDHDHDHHHHHHHHHHHQAGAWNILNQFLCTQKQKKTPLWVQGTGSQASTVKLCPEL